MRGLVLVTALVVGAMAAPLAAQDADIEAGPVPQIAFFVRITDALPSGGDAPLLRQAAINRARTAITIEQYPAELLDARGARDTEALLEVTVGADGMPTACRADGMAIVEGRNRDLRELPAPLAQHACDLALGEIAYHHALDGDGHPVAANVPITISFRWERPSLPPAPWSPASWIPSVDGWPPRYFYADTYRGMAMEQPQWSRFIAADRDRPRRAEVGLLFSNDQTGTVTECRVARPSGIAAFDTASCLAIRSVQQNRVVQDFPLLLRWNRNRAEIVWPGRSVGPELSSQLTLPPETAANYDVPAWSGVVVELAIDPEGHLQSCTIMRPLYIDALDVASCALFGPETRFTQPRGLFGEPAEGRLRLELDWNRLTYRRWGS